MLNAQRHSPSSAIAGIALLVGAVGAADIGTPLGIAVWVLYLVPLALTLLLPNPALPLLVAAAATLLMGVGFVASPSGVSGDIAIVNRGFAILVIWMVAALARWLVLTRARVQRLNWLQEGHAHVARSGLGEQTVEALGDSLVRALCEYLGARVGAIYRLDGGVLHRIGGYALDAAGSVPQQLALGEGLAGEAARDGVARSVTSLPNGYLRVRSALGEAAPTRLLVAPFTADGEITGVVEFGLLNGADDSAVELELLHRISESIGLPIRSAIYRTRLLELLEETQRQAEELQAQQEELQAANEELEEQSSALRQSQARLEHQQAELQQTNSRLEQQAERLERQRHELLLTQDSLSASAESLERASRYKSQFLANMSHELRTPLNSSLILSTLLADNRAGNLNDEQVRHAQAIRDANEALLELINDILDLSKIEAGHVEIETLEVTLESVLAPLEQIFAPVAAEKGLPLAIVTAPSAPATLVTDSRRLQQILRNLLSNAIKFTDRGSVTLRVAGSLDGMVAFTVADTGIGIEPALQEAIFDAFRQADGSTSRRYGGTGLGLSISRELTKLLGGEIAVDSVPGHGSTFTLSIPAKLHAPGKVPAAVLDEPAAEPLLAYRDSVAPEVGDLPQPTPATRIGTRPDEGGPAPIADDRERRSRGERLILVVEDDPAFARILYDLAHEQDFDCVHATNGSDAVELARRLRPAGVLLDVGLPDRSGLSVLESLKRDPVTRHIPVHVVAASDHVRTALELGAIGYELKPVERRRLEDALSRIEHRLQRSVRRLLLVEDDAALRQAVTELLASAQVEIVAVGTVADASAQLDGPAFDCVVMDLTLPDGTGFDLLDRMAADEARGFPPVVVYTGRAIGRDEEQRLRRHAGSIVVKGARSPERLLDEVMLFLHMVETDLPVRQRRMLEQARMRDRAFEGRRVLVAEDDARNIFALSSVIEPLGAAVEIARNGLEALERLRASPGAIDLVLMDIMMPEMDGLTAIREIRRDPALARLPIIALTAKAMADDRRDCLQAGANDYIAKPIDVDRLVSLMRVWMPK
jgi:CheY-like chemotaxis protein